MGDARFQDASGHPLRLIAEDAGDLAVISTMVQDAVFPSSEMSWRPAGRRFGLLLNRFRWEDAAVAGRAPERVQAVLEISDVIAVRSQGIDRKDKDLVLSLMSVEWQQKGDGLGRMTLTLAGDGAIPLDVECLNATLTDVTRPYLAPSGQRPAHPE